MTKDIDIYIVIYIEIDIDIDIDIDVGPCPGRIPCNGDVQRFSEGLVCIYGLASEVVLVVRSRR